MVLIKYTGLSLFLYSTFSFAESIDIDNLLNQAQQKGNIKINQVNGHVGSRLGQAMNDFKTSGKETDKLLNQIQSRNLEMQKISMDIQQKELEKSRAEARRKEEERQRTLANNAAFEERRRSALLYEREMAMREKEHIDNMYKISTVTIDNSKKQEQEMWEAQKKAYEEAKKREQELEKRNAANLVRVIGTRNSGNLGYIFTVQNPSNYQVWCNITVKIKIYKHIGIVTGPAPYRDNVQASSVNVAKFIHARSTQDILLQLEIPFAYEGYVMNCSNPT